MAWVTVCIVWGTTYLAIRIALESIPPMLMAAMRWIAAGGILIAVLGLRGTTLPGPRAWPALTILGVLLLGFGNGAVVWAEQTVPSGLTAVLVATAPFWMVGIERFMFGSDGPHVMLQPGLEQFLRLDLTNAERKQVLVDNARRIYRF